MKEKLPQIGAEIDQVTSADYLFETYVEDGEKHFSRKGFTKNFAGKWTYDFKNDKLNKYHFDACCEDVNRENFIFYLKNTKQVIDFFKKEYGEPFHFSSENQKFKDPFSSKHYGYNVLSGEWKTNEMDFKIQFKFNGAAEDYNFLFKMEFYDSGYEN